MPTRGKDTAVFATDSSGTGRTLTTYLTNITDSLESENLDTTTFGSSYKSSVRGYLGWSGSLSGVWDSAASANPDQWMSDLITAAATVTSTLTIFPNGSASGAKYHRGAVFFSNYNTESAVDGIVTWSVDYALPSGSVTFGTA